MSKVGNDTGFGVVMGIDMETDIGSFTSTYEGVHHEKLRVGSRRAI